jgi:hypothetical protein
MKKLFNHFAGEDDRCALSRLSTVLIACDVARKTRSADVCHLRRKLGIDEIVCDLLIVKIETQQESKPFRPF